MIDLRHVVSLSLLITGLAGAGCTAPPETADRPSSKPNIVMVLIDTLRADRLSVYGYPADTSPRLDGLAEQMVVFERAHSPAPWTLPSVVSLMLSQPVCEHGVVVDRQQIVDTAVPLAERLTQLGYRSGAFFVNPYAGKMSGLDRGFERSELVTRQNDGEQVEAWLDATAPERGEARDPFFLYLHNTEPHRVFSAEKRHLDSLGHSVGGAQKDRIKELMRRFRRSTRVDFVKGRPIGTTDNSERQQELMQKLESEREAFSELYDAQVRAADDRIGNIVDALEARGLWENTLLVVLSDHGEEMGEHGGWLHDQSIYEEMIHVPLLLKLPGGKHGGRRIETPVTLLDVVPTVLEVVGEPADRPGIRGSSLLQMLEPGVGQPRRTSIRLNRKKFYRPFKESRGDLNVAVVDGSWKGIFNPEVDSFELYDLASDPGELQNLTSREPQVARRLLQIARADLGECQSRANATPADATLDPEQLDALRSLGYVGGDETAEEQ